MNNKQPRLWCPFCPVCRDRLYTRKEGFACKNHRCPLYHKRSTGWILSRIGIWVYQDKRVLRNIKIGLHPNIDRVQILLGAYALSVAKENKKKEGEK